MSVDCYQLSAANPQQAPIPCSGYEHGQPATDICFTLDLDAVTTPQTPEKSS